MSEPDAKKIKANDDAAYTLVYWPSIPGRAEFVRLLFEEAGVPYTDVAKSDKECVKKVLGIMSPDNKGDTCNPAAFAPPCLKHGALKLSQTPNILLYLAPKLGLAPTEGDGIYHLNEIVLTILDGFSNEIHETHHPVSTSAYYGDQKPEAKRRAQSYTSERLPKFLAYVQRVLDSKTSGDGPWLYGGNLTYADLVLFQVRARLRAREMIELTWCRALMEQRMRSPKR